MHADPRQLELMYAMIKFKGPPSGAGDWQKIAETLTDQPAGEAVRSRWRVLEAKLKQHDWSVQVAKGTVNAKNSLVGSAGSKKKAKNPQAKSVAKSSQVDTAEPVEDNEDASIQVDDEIKGHEERMTTTMAGSKRKREAFEDENYYNDDSANDHLGGYDHSYGIGGYIGYGNNVNYGIDGYGNEGYGNDGYGSNSFGYSYDDNNSWGGGGFNRGNSD